MKMKKLLMSSLVLTAFALAITLFQISCKKEAIAQTTNMLTKDQILVQKTWKVDRLHHVIGGVYSGYISGAANTTGISYDKMRFTFNSNGTGTIVDPSGNSYPLTWQFNNSDKRSISISVPSLSVNNTWDMVEIADNYLHASSNLTISGNSNNIETFRLVQIP
jgi:hypothetical protein